MASPPAGLLRWFGHPARVAPAAYAAGWLVGTGLLLLPVATRSGQHTGFAEASFTAMSALCITGLVVVDTATHWTLFGHVVILALIQLGGFGIMTLATLLLVGLTGRRASLEHRLVARGETRARSLGDLRGLPTRIALTMLVVETVVAGLLTLGFRPHVPDWGSAAWYGVFHAISAFNNAGFGLDTANLVPFNAVPGIMLPVCLAVVLGGLGFPVYVELFLRRGRRLRRFALRHGLVGPHGFGRTWSRGDVGARRPLSVHLVLTVWGTVVLLVVGFAAFALWEWPNPHTLGPAAWDGKLLGALGGAVFPRTAGFNSIDYGQATQQTIFVNYLLMFIGGGSAGTAGGVKITTVAVLAAAVWTELRGERSTLLLARRVSSRAQRQALAIAVLGASAVAFGTLAVLSLSDAPLRQVLFEVVSAFGTVGLSMGLTPELPPSAWAVLTALMYVGRVGVLSVGAALALGRQHRRFDFPEEDPLVG